MPQTGQEGTSTHKPVILYIKESAQAYKIKLERKAGCDKDVWCNIVTGNSTLLITLCTASLHGTTFYYLLLLIVLNVFYVTEKETGSFVFYPNYTVHIGKIHSVKRLH